MSQKTQTGSAISLPLFLGCTQIEQVKSLQQIKDAMADVLIQAHVAGDCAFNTATVEYVTAIYMQADNLVDQLLIGSTIN